MRDVEIWTSETCRFCVEAKRILQSMGISYAERDLAFNPPQAFIKATNGAKTVPQILVGDVLIGGHAELIDAIDSGRFQQLLKGEDA